MALRSAVVSAVMVSAVMVSVAAACRSDASVKQTRVDAASANPPVVQAILQGPVRYHDDSYKMRIKLMLTLDLIAPRGTITMASEAYDLVDPHLTLLASGHADPLSFKSAMVRYRLRYVIDQCQHTSPAATMEKQWNPCLYYEGQKRPQHLVPGELLILWDRSDPGVGVRAVGTPRLDNLSESYHLTGTVVQPEDNRHLDTEAAHDRNTKCGD